jgi:hypothetical protein
MSDATATLPDSINTCPPNCNARHQDGESLHLFPERTVTDLYGKTVHISRFLDDATGRAGVYVGDYEFDAEVAAGLAQVVRTEAYEAVAASLSRR